MLNMLKLMILLSIFCYIDLKAVHYAEDPYKGYYDHMYNHMYLKETPGVQPGAKHYEAQYVPHVDGRPIYVPQIDPRYEQYKGSQYDYSANQQAQYGPDYYKQPIPNTPKQETPEEWQARYQNWHRTVNNVNHLSKPNFAGIEISNEVETSPAQNINTPDFTSFHKKPQPAIPMPTEQQYPQPIQHKVPPNYSNKAKKPIIKEKGKVDKPEKYTPNHKFAPPTDKLTGSHDVMPDMNYEYDEPQIVDAKLTNQLGNEESDEEYDYSSDEFRDTNDSSDEYDGYDYSEERISNDPKEPFTMPKDKIKVPVPHKPNKVLKEKPSDYGQKEAVKHDSVPAVSKKPMPTPTSDEYEPVLVVESLIKKPNKKDEIEDYEWDRPVVVEALTKRKPKPHKINPSKEKVHSKPIHESDKYSNADVAINSKPILTKPPNVALKVPADFPPEETNMDIDLENADKLEELSPSQTSVKPVRGPDGDSENYMRSNIWSMMSSFHSQERNKFKKCLTPDHEPGNCMPIQMCPVPNLQLTLDDLLKKVCSIDEVFIGICCPEFPAETLKVKWANMTEAPSQPEPMHNKEKKPLPECGILKDSEKLKAWPWMAPLISASNRRIFCGGVLIHNQYVLTAAHCTRKIPHNQILVILGAMTSHQDPLNKEFEVIEIKRHAQYNQRTMKNDIALLKLSKPVDVGEQKRFICLPKDDKIEGKTALMLGWQGSFVASKNEEFLKIISTEDCKKGVKMSVSESTVCTEPRTEDVMCNLDSGAPLVIEENGKYEVVGILTWNRNDCDSSFPSVFTRVSHFRKWIENHLS